MRGCVYRLAVPHRHIDEHPHVVVVVSGNQCFVVPAYTPGKHSITEAINALERMGIPRDKACVELDNSKHISGHKEFKGHVACWFTYTAYWASKSVLEQKNYIGVMDEAGMEKIAQGILALADYKSELFSPKHLMQIRQWLRSSR